MHLAQIYQGIEGLLGPSLLSNLEALCDSSKMDVQVPMRLEPHLLRHTRTFMEF